MRYYDSDSDKLWSGIHLTFDGKGYTAKYRETKTYHRHGKMYCVIVKELIPDAV